MEKEIVFVLLDDFADWEAAFLAPALRAGTMPGRPASYGVKYMTPDGRPVRSIGGLRAAADCDASALPEACAGLILVGGMQWQSEAAQRIVPLVGEALARGIVVGAICNAVSFMAAHGFLNGIRHTGNTLGMLQKWGGANYTGEALYEERQAVQAQDLIRLGQAALCAQLLCKALKRLLSPEGLQKQEDLLGQCRCGGTGRLGYKVRQPLHNEGAGALGIGQHLPVLLGVMAVIPRRAAGKGLPPIGGGQLPCVGVVFKGTLLAFRQIDQPGLEQTQHAAA